MTDTLLCDLRYVLRGLRRRPGFAAIAIVTLFAALALTLGAVGIYGVMAHLVAQRTREIGIRMALGAVPAEILRLVAMQGTVMAVAGIVLGTAGSLVTTRLLAGVLYQVRPTDPLTVDPIEALRND